MPPDLPSDQLLADALEVPKELSAEDVSGDKALAELQFQQYLVAV